MPGSGRRARSAHPRPLRTLILVLALALVLSACTRPPVQTRPTPGPTATLPSALRIGIEPVPSLDPAALEGDDALLVAAQLYDGLVAYDPVSGTVVPAVAEGWDVLAGGTRFVFHLRETTFHDGSPVRAADFVAAWTRLVDPTAQRPFAFLLESVRGFARHRQTFGARPFDGLEAPDDRTLVVELVTPWPDFVAVLTHPALSPVPPAVESPGFAVRPVGNGPFRLVEDVVLDGPIRLVASDQALTPPRIAALEYLSRDTPEQSWPDFLAGDLDIARIPAELVDEVDSEAGVQPLARLLYCGFNAADPRFREPALREAVSVGIDREALVDEVYGDLAVAADGIVAPSIPSYRPDLCGARCDHDPDRARSLVEGLRPRARSFAIDVPATGVGEQLATAISAQLAGVGIQATPRLHDEEAYAQLLREGAQELFCLTAVADYPRAQAVLEPLFAAGSADNLTGVSDAPLDGLLRRARAEADPVDREELYIDAEQRALEVLALAPIAWFRSRFAVQSYVEGFTLDPMGMFDAAALSIRP